MKTWFECFFLSFFSHRTAKESARRGYGATFLGFLLALVLLWMGFFGADTLPFGTQYRRSPDFAATVHATLASSDADRRLNAELRDGILLATGQDGEGADGLLLNTLESESDRQAYSVGGYGVVVDLRPADTLAEVDAYCVSSDGTGDEISYEEYLTLNDVARRNFEFKLRYTGNALVLDDETVAGYRAYVDAFSAEYKAKADGLAKDLSDGKLTSAAYARAVYELYFTAYYPAITAYESTSAVPLLRNYYYHEYIRGGNTRYLFVFDDYVTGSFETGAGNTVAFYGFYDGIEDGPIVSAGATQEEANAEADGFVRRAVGATRPLRMYANALNTISLAPFLALMLLVATLITYSLLKLRAVDSISTLGATLKIVGSFAWCAGAISACLTVAASFFVGYGAALALLPVLFFLALGARSILFFIKERKLYIKQLEQQEHTEV